MSDHTREPWKVFERKHPYHIDAHEGFGPARDGEHIEYTIGTDWIHPQLKDNYPIVTLSVGMGTEKGKPVYMVGLSKANAHRIVACVNACAGMDDPAAQIARLKAELAEARRIVHNLAEHNHSFAALKIQARNFLAKYPEEP